MTRGQKSENDLVLEVRTASGWRNVKMETGFLMADFLAENEDQLVADGYFPATAAGGAYYLKHLTVAVRDGWQAATKQVEAARTARRFREGRDVPSITSVLCATCGAAPTGTFPDGSPRYSCVHEPLRLAAGNELF